MEIEQVRRALERMEPPRAGAAVLIPLIRTEQGLFVLLEQRAFTLEVQPGEVCLPGGRIEAGESPQEAAVRETCEELLVRADQIELLGSLGAMEGPGGLPLHAFVGELAAYEGTFSKDEVDHCFTLSLDWLMTHAPEIYEVRQTPSYPDDFPWELVPGGRAYPWRSRTHRVPFYRGTDPVLWGATARVLDRFVQLLKRQG
ncbi:MAG: CoA pyrophosphatase [Coriobacteriales bacterium]|nr:CoA pyrophosphatase [Coriobacteriales bacterium]